MTYLKHLALGFVSGALHLLLAAYAIAQETADAPADASAPDVAGPPPAAASQDPAAVPSEAPAPVTYEPLTPPPADDPTRDSASSSPYSYETGGLAGVGIVAGLKGGVGIGLGAFGTTPVAELELGYLLPPLDRSIEVFASFQYAWPKAEGDDIEDTYALEDESRLPGTANFEIVERQAVLTLGALYRIPLDLPQLRPYAGLGGRLYLTEAVIEGSAGGQDFGENRETDTQAGFFGALGLEAYLGPGAALLELQLGYAKVDAYVLRGASATALNIALGYRIFI